MLRAFTDPLDEIHPHYALMLCDSNAYWQRWRAILDGFEYASQKEEFLPAADFEKSTNAAFRRSITHFQGVSLDALDAITASVFGGDPIISSDNEQLAEWIANVWPGGLVAWLESHAWEVAAMGVGFVWVDAVRDTSRRMSDADPGANVPVLRWFAPEELDNWEESDRPTWCKTRRLVVVKDSARSEAAYYLERHEITSESIRVHKKQVNAAMFAAALDPSQEIPGGYELAGPEIAHGLGRLPVIDWQAVPTERFRGDSFIESSARHDVDLLNHGSWQSMALYRHAHPLPIFRSDRAPESITIGPHDGLAILPNEDFRYAELPVAAFESRESVMSRIRRTGCRASGMVDETADGPNQSGISMRVRWTQRQRRALDQFARSCERVGREIIDLARQYMGLDEAVMEGVTVSFKASYDIAEAREMIGDYLSLAPYIESPIFHADAQKAAAAKLLPNQDPRRRDAMLEQIETQPRPEFIDPDLGD